MELSEELINKIREKIERFFNPVLWYMFWRTKASKNGHADHSADGEYNKESGLDLLE